MKILVDTHCWLWMQVSPERFSRTNLDIFADPVTELLLSAASAWEIAIKYALGKLPLPLPPAQYLPSRMQTSRTVSLPILQHHVLHVAALPQHHRDPFDRLIIAQAGLEQLPILTADPVMSQYAVKVITP